MNAVEVHNLRKEFVRKDGRKRTRVAALRGITFEIARGECIAILGQNGSGKSTLVRLLSTLLLPDGGSARIFGHDISRDAGRPHDWSTASRSRPRSSRRCRRPRTSPTRRGSTG